ncbi:hypothetical protein CLU79DRAFT_776569 [Phycomyces nitens]|nr:hypothetical protein CLU79DRAFT_776569 [Phycomyces nitens]
MSATNLPLEVILLIGKSLSQKDRLACTTVCKAWSEGFTKSLWSTILPATQKAFKKLCDTISSKQGQEGDYSYVKEMIFTTELKPTVKQVELLQKHFKNLNNVILGCDFGDTGFFGKKIDWKPWSKIKSLTVDDRFRESPENMSDFLDVLPLLTCLEDLTFIRPDKNPLSLKEIDEIPNRLPKIKTMLLSCTLGPLSTKDVRHIEELERGKEGVQICLCVTLIDFRWIYYFLRKYRDFGDFNITFPDDIKRKRLYTDQMVQMVKAAGDEVTKDTKSLLVYEREDGPRLNRLLMESLKEAGVTYSDVSFVTPKQFSRYTNGLQLADFFKNIPQDIKKIQVGMGDMEKFILFSEEICSFPVLESLVIETAVCERPEKLLRNCPKLKELNICLPEGCNMDGVLGKSQYGLESLTVPKEWISADILSFFSKRCGKLNRLDLCGVDLVCYPLSDDGSTVINMAKQHFKSVNLSCKDIVLPMKAKEYETDIKKLHLICVVQMNSYKPAPIKRNGKGESLLSNNVVTRDWYHLYSSDRDPDGLYFYSTHNIRRLKKDEVEYAENYFRDFSNKEDRDNGAVEDMATLMEEAFLDKEDWKESLERGFLEFRCASMDKFVSPYMTE